MPSGRSVSSEPSFPSTFPIYAADRLRAEGFVLETDREFFTDRRRVKSAAELGGIRRAQAAADAGMERARELLASSVPGAGGVLEINGAPLTSEVLHAEIAAAFVENDSSSDVFVASHGPQTAIGHHLGEGPIRAGEPVIVDIWPRDNRSACFTDMTRTFVAGEPPAEVAEWHRLSLEWLDLALGLVRPGVTAKSIYDAVCDEAEAAGFPTQRTKADGEILDSGFIFALGHGVGLEVHEEPILGMLGHSAIVAGDVLAIEPGLYRVRRLRRPGRGSRPRHRGRLREARQLLVRPRCLGRDGYRLYGGTFGGRSCRSCSTGVGALRRGAGRA